MKADGFKSQEDFISYLQQTLIPDLVESGRFETAKDFRTAIKFMLGLGERSKFIHLKFSEEEFKIMSLALVGFELSLDGMDSRKDILIQMVKRNLKQYNKQTKQQKGQTDEDYFELS